MYGDITEEAVVWNAEDYSQQNPLKTDETGFYRWDVPQGLWQVKYEKEGYETTYSDWLPEKINDSLRASGRHVSVDAPFVEGEENSLLDVMTNPDSPMADKGLVSESLSTEIDRALGVLNEREKQIIERSFGINNQPEMTLEEIGETFGLTRERVRQIREKAIRKLRAGSRNSLLRMYLG